MAIKKYFKFDEVNQFLEDETDINYFATNQRRRIAVGNMLGDFNEQGIYVLDKNLIQELVQMPKIIADSVDGADLIRSAVRFDSFVHFMLTIEEDKASLILLEKINFESNVKYNAGSYTNMNEYVLEELPIPDRDVDKNVIYAKFNILREDEGKYYEYADLNQEETAPFSHIIDKIKYNLLVQNLMLKKEKEIEIIEADYFDNVLASFNDYKKQKEEFEELLKKALLDKKDFLIINRPFFAKTINEILDNCLSVYLSKLSPELRALIEEKIRKAKEKYYKAYINIIHLQLVDNLTGVVKQEDTMIAELTKPEDKVVRFEIDEKELEKSFFTILEENSKYKVVRARENSGEEVIRFDNPVLSKFFDTIKKEFGVDMLKNKEAVVKRVDEMIKKELEKTAQQNKPVQKEEKKVEKPKPAPVEEKKEVKKVDSSNKTKDRAPSQPTKPKVKDNRLVKSAIEVDTATDIKAPAGAIITDTKASGAYREEEEAVDTGLTRT